MATFMDLLILPSARETQAFPLGSLFFQVSRSHPSSKFASSHGVLDRMLNPRSVRSCLSSLMFLLL